MWEAEDGLVLRPHYTEDITECFLLHSILSVVPCPSEVEAGLGQDSICSEPQSPGTKDKEGTLNPGRGKEYALCFHTRSVTHFTHMLPA